VRKLKNAWSYASTHRAVRVVLLAFVTEPSESQP